MMCNGVRDKRCWLVLVATVLFALGCKFLFLFFFSNSNFVFNSKISSQLFFSFLLSKLVMIHHNSTNQHNKNSLFRINSIDFKFILLIKCEQTAATHIDRYRAHNPRTNVIADHLTFLSEHKHIFDLIFYHLFIVVLIYIFLKQFKLN